MGGIRRSRARARRERMADRGPAFGAARLVRAGLVTGLLLSGRALAQDAPSQDGWRFQVTPYLWTAGFSGDVRLGRRVPSFRVGESFGDVLEDLDAGFFLTGLAIRDRLILTADLSYVAVSRKGQLLASPPISAKGSLDQFSTTLLGGYRTVRASGFDLDFLAGLRAWSINADVAARVAGAPFLDRSESIGWMDPILGLRTRADLAPRLSAHLIADLGGFGAGSRFTWQIAGLLNFQLTDSFFASAGYRHLAVDYREDGRRLDFNLSGPVFGVTYRF